MEKPVLIIMAAGMGSRYGGLKQIDTVDAEGDKIIDFSIYDASLAGFSKIIFIIKRENHEIFKEAIGDKISRTIDVEYVFQDLSDVPDGKINPDRVKPYGTAHAVRACRNIVKGPFAVINADDFYGRHAFKEVYNYLTAEKEDSGMAEYCMVGFRLINTLTENGSVSRGICTVDDEGYLTDIVERTKIIKNTEGAAYTENDKDYIPLADDTLTSMNIWGFSGGFMGELEKAFDDFYYNELPDNPLKAECYLPFVVDDLLKEKKARVKVLKSSDRWFGVTYKEDKEFVREQISELKEKGEYPKILWK